MDNFPENLNSIFREEDRIQKWARESITSDKKLLDFVNYIDTYMDSVEALRNSGTRSDAHIAYVALFIRTFNDLANCIRLSMSGYHSSAAMVLRDLLETNFLLDYLLEDESIAIQWMKASNQDFQKYFSAKTIRNALDKRDGFTTNKRAQHYWLLSSFGSHPSPQSIDLMRDGGWIIHKGPFKQITSLTQIIEEATKLALLLTDLLIPYHKLKGPEGSERSRPLSIASQKMREIYLKS